MKRLKKTLLRLEFEYRIFVSFGIVLCVYIVASVFYPHTSSNIVLLGEAAGVDHEISTSIGYLGISLLLTFSSLLRMWSGSILSSQRVMAFKVQVNALLIKGPYRAVRNPIYLADLIAICAFALCLPPIGLFMPAMFYFHYVQLIRYEETMFRKERTPAYETYVLSVPRLFPKPRSLKNFSRGIREFKLNRDGIRHNALYVLFVIGFIVGAFVGDFSYALFIGIPAVIDWAVVHTKIGLPKSVSTSKKVFESVLYAQCWEDPALDREAFRIAKDDVVFSITSGGCNLLAFLIDNPAKVIALDINPSQNYLLEIKVAGFKMFSYGEMLEFLGVEGSNRRLELYKRVRGFLSNEAREYWDGRPEDIDRGVIHCGRFEKYMRLLRVIVTRLVGREVIDQFFSTEDCEERAKLYADRWNSVGWKFFTRIMLSRTVMSLLFDGAFFAQLEEKFSFGKHFEKKVKKALTKLPMKENCFLAYMLFGRYYSRNHLPLYLRHENFDLIRQRLYRISIVTDSCEKFFESLPDNSISKFNFTNIFEWMPEQTYEQLLKKTIRVAKPGATITYRNLLVHRERPESLGYAIDPHRELAQWLHQRDLSFIYDNYAVETVRKEDMSCRTESRQSVVAER